MQPNSLLTDASIDALVKIREMSPDPIKDRDIIERALVAYVSREATLAEIDRIADVLRRRLAELDAKGADSREI